MQDIAEGLVRHCRKKAKIAIDRPFQLCCRHPVRGQHSIKGRLAPQPLQGLAIGHQEGAVFFGGARHAFFAVVENFNVARIARRIPIQRLLPAT